MPFIIENGGFPTRYRGWNNFGPTWTTHIEDAIQYARRKDAESQHAEDEDAVFIREVDAEGEIIPNGPFGVMEVDGGQRWAVIRSVPESGQVLALLTFGEGVFSPEEARICCMICASALNGAVPKLKLMREAHDAMIAQMLGKITVGWTPGSVEVHLHGDTVQAVVHEMTATNLTPTEVLHLFSEFVHRNCTQWRTGGGDHHHPIWGLVATILDGKLPITEGVDWAFIQPENRLSIEALRSTRGRIESMDGQ